MGATLANAAVSGHRGGVYWAHGFVGVQVLEGRITEVTVRLHEYLPPPRCELVGNP
jgi:hypothetical protein